MMAIAAETPACTVQARTGPASNKPGNVKGRMPEAKGLKEKESSATRQFYEDLLGPFRRFYFHHDQPSTSGAKQPGALQPPGQSVTPVRSKSCDGQLEHQKDSTPQRLQPNGSRALRLGASAGSVLNPQPSCGTLREKYGTVSSFLGKGSNGSCYLVRRPSDHAGFAVKEFRNRRSDESAKDYIKKVTTEYTIGTLLDHPNIIHTHDLIIDKSHCYEVMELCEGGDLFEAISSSRTPIPIDQANCIFIQLLRGVAYLHSLGICHRDLKPENCLFDAQGHLKIIDFGCADVFKGPFDRDLKKSHGRCGSGPYIAPEEFTCTDYDGRKVDVWACAIIYLCILTKRFPWRMASMKDPDFAFYARTPNHRLRLLDSVPADVRALIRSMLDLDPSKRPTIEEILASPWAQSVKVCENDQVHQHGRKSLK